MMAEEDRQLVILVAAAVLVFGILLALIVVGMLTRYRLENPPRPEVILAPEHQGSELLHRMRLPFRPGPAEGTLLTPAPVTNSQYGWYADAAGAPPPASFLEPARSGGKAPVLVADPAEARAFCAWLSAETGLALRLPRREELEPGPAESEWMADAPPGEAPRPFRCALDR